MKSKLENGEVIEQEKRFLEWVKARDDDWWEDEARISIWDFRVMQEFFKEEVTNALNQQRSQIIEKIKREAFPEDKVMRRYLDEFLTKLEK